MSNPRPASTWRDFTQVSVTRSLSLMAFGALTGLALAGYALFTARGTSTLIVPAEDVALVNQQPVSRVDYVAQLQTLYGVDFMHATPAQRKKVLDDMIREELFVQRGKELDVAGTDPDVRNAMVNAVELEIGADALTARPTEAKLRAYYADHRSQYASEGLMTLQDWLFPAGDAADAARAAKSLETAAPTAALMSALNGRQSATMQGEEFYFAAKIHLGAPLFEIARGLADGTPSAPIAMPDGIHVLYMVKNALPRPFDFASARERVLTDYQNAAVAHLRTGDESFLRKRANVLIADDLR